MTDPTPPSRLDPRAEPDDWLAVAPEPPPATPIPDGTERRRPLRLYLVAGVVLVIVVGVALAAPVLFGSSGSDDASVDDHFDRTSTDGLGEVGGVEWEAVTGSFAIDDGAAVVSEPNDVGPRTITVIETGATNGRIEVTVGNATPGWAVIFRYANPFNYWYLQAAPDYGVMNAVRVSNGEVQSIGATALASLRAGAEITVVLDGTNITVEADDTEVFALTSDHCLGATKAGLLGLVDPQGASWEVFRAVPDEEDPGPTTIKLPAAASTTTTEEESPETTAEPEQPASTTTTLPSE